MFIAQHKGKQLCFMQRMKVGIVYIFFNPRGINTHKPQCAQHMNDVLFLL